MSNAKKSFRIVFAMFGLALATPAVLSITASIGSASGYMVASGIVGEIICSPGGGEECPEGGTYVDDKI
jgi:hypothetical protein